MSKFAGTVPKFAGTAPNCCSACFRTFTRVRYFNPPLGKEFVIIECETEKFHAAFPKKFPRHFLNILPVFHLIRSEFSSSSAVWDTFYWLICVTSGVIISSYNKQHHSTTANLGKIIVITH